jgi:hypothetical protein
LWGGEVGEIYENGGGVKENLFLFAMLLFKVGWYCGFWPGLVILLVAESCGFRVVEIGIEKVFERAVSRDTSIVERGEGNQPAREVLARCA